MNNSTNDRSVKPYLCPKCGKRGKWRMGVGFDDMMRCADCKVVWEPDAVETKLREMTLNKVNVDGDGI